MKAQELRIGNWWTEPNPEGVSNMDVLEVLTLFIIPYMALLWFVVRPCV